MKGKKIKELMNRFVEIFVIETLTRAFEEKNAKNAENSTRMPCKACCGHRVRGG